MAVALPLGLMDGVCYADGTDEPMEVPMDHKQIFQSSSSWRCWSL